MNFWNLALFELAFVLLVIFSLGLIRIPAVLRRKRLIRGFPWGYYRNNLPHPDGQFFAEDSTDFLHNTGAKFEGVPGLGLTGQFQAHGFGQGMSDW
jgi:hypothetical protein